MMVRVFPEIQVVLGMPTKEKTMITTLDSLYRLEFWAEDLASVPSL